ncbi:MAG: S41 family peptidase [Candidatus Portnoybacteria bacterium]
MRKHIPIFSYIILLVAVFSFGYFVGQADRPSIEKIGGVVNKEGEQTIAADFSLFWDAWHVIEESYVGRSNLDRQEMIFGAISGLLNSLDDPHSVFLKPQESKRFLDDISGSFGGIGAEVGIRNGILTVISPLEGNPAQEAGLMAGDKILKVDDTLTADLNLDEAVNIIRGKEGTDVNLLIASDELEGTKEITITRATIKIPIIKWEMLENNIVHIELFHFTESAISQFKKTVKEINSVGAEGIILDVRNNPGGFLEVAVDIASWFLPKGELVVLEDFGNEKKSEYKSRGYDGIEDLPVVVLINEGSASASEIVAGALKDIRGITTIGQKSFGKGSVQQLEKLKGGSSIKITVAKWLTPSGTSINDEGIIPDVEIEITQEDFDELRDPQLEKALEILKNNND